MMSVPARVSLAGMMTKPKAMTMPRAWSISSG